MSIEDFLVCLAGAFLAWTLHYCAGVYIKKREKDWPYIAVFIQPETGRLYAVRKNKKGKYKYYINSMRVPKKMFIHDGNT